MVGFAGETDEEFAQSLDFVEQIAFAKAHVFPYSIRPGTAAAKRTDQIDPPVKEARSRAMLQTAAKSRAAFLESQLGRTFEVLFETTCKDGSVMGYTPNYTPVHVRAEDILQNQILPVRLISSDGERCIGEIAES